MWINVKSTNVAAIDQDGKDLLVKFHSGDAYRYYGAGKHFNDMLAPGSKGKYLNANIKGHYGFIKL